MGWGEDFSPSRGGEAVALSDAQPCEGGWVVRALRTPAFTLAWDLEGSTLTQTRPPRAPSDVVTAEGAHPGEAGSSGPFLNVLGASGGRGGSLAESGGSSEAGGYLAPSFTMLCWFEGFILWEPSRSPVLLRRA